ncbi:MAG: hypothetical protein CL930_11245 [Deltaproteobacteria bacterium]|nr:hypothetical protein [Deltaproteobacteria bacterium]
MTSQPSNSVQQPTLSEAHCLFHRGPLAHPGVLSLTNDYLTFRPTRTLDRIAGAKDVVIPTKDITQYSAGGINDNVDIYTEDETFRFSGRGALRVNSRLSSLLAQGDEDAEDSIRLLFEPDERVLQQGRIELFVNDFMAVRGELTLTDRRFRFTPGSGIDRMFWETGQIDARLDTLEDWRLTDLRRLLRMTIDGEEHVFGGSLTPELYNHIERLIGTGDTTQQGTNEVVLDTWKVQLRRGPVAHNGDLSFTPTTISYTPTGLLDAMVGVKGFSFAIEDISRIALRGWPDRKLMIRVGHEIHNFALPDPSEKLAAIEQLIRDRQYQLARRQTPDHEHLHQRCLDRWTSTIEFDEDEYIVLKTYACERQGKAEIRFGWLILSRSRVLFLPIGGPASQERHMDAPLEQIFRLDGGPRSRQDQISLSIDDKTARFLVSDREGIVDEFWSQCRSPSRIIAWDTLGPKSMARILGQCRFVRIICLGDTLVDMTPGMTVTHEAGVAAVLPGEPGSSVPTGTVVTVEIGQIEGIYQYDSKVIRSIPTPLEGVIPNPLGTHLLITRFPNELRLYNQRDSYRVGLEMDVQGSLMTEMADGGSWMSTNQHFASHVLDLSIGGCGLETAYELNEGDRVSLNLPLLDEWVDIRATTVRIGGEDPSNGTFRYGLEFRELTMAQEDILHKAVMTMQRTALADDDENEEGESEVEIES